MLSIHITYAISLQDSLDGDTSTLTWAMGELDFFFAKVYYHKVRKM